MSAYCLGEPPKPGGEPKPMAPFGGDTPNIVLVAPAARGHVTSNYTAVAQGAQQIERLR